MRISDWSSDVCSSDLVHDGIMFVPTAGARVQAIDAKTGEFIWDYRYRLPSGEWPSPLPNRGIALFADMVFLATPDAAIVAIDAGTGDRKSTRLNSILYCETRMPSSACKKKNVTI